MRDKKRIMLVDDQFISRLLLQEALKDDYEIDSYASPLKALHTLEQGRPDLIITDLMMPGMSGFDFSQKARQMYPDLPVLAVSAYSGYRLNDPERAFAFDDFLAKPFRVASLQQKVQKILRHPACLKC